MTEQIEWTDRYGGNYPDPKTVCKGQCEGMGCVPIHEGMINPDWKPEPGKLGHEYKEEDATLFRDLWDEAEQKEHADDGVHFVKCPECGGTGKRKEE